MTERLMIEDTSVYELDEECLRQKKEQKHISEQPVFMHRNRNNFAKDKEEPAP